MATSPNLARIESFYAAFNECDGDTMAAAYAPDAHFYDPVFEDLNGEEPGAMWRMLTGQAQDLRVELAESAADGDSGSARWIAHYTFSQTGRKVTNDVSATFTFNGDGLITDHRDDFSFYGWSKQALGPPGLLLGWTPIVRGATRKRARASLDKFMAGASSSPEPPSA
jgi:ketosteroid isomerase-like protein